MPNRPRRAVILLSGGLDSATVLALAREEGLACHALTLRYGQEHAIEIECARRLAASLGAAEHRVMDIDLRSFGGSSLVGDGPIPLHPLEPRSPASFGARPPAPSSEEASATPAAPSPEDQAPPAAPSSSAIPSTYVPARNTVFLSLALAWAEVLSAESIHLGVNAVDFSGYPDCRPEFVAAFQNLVNVATRRTVEGAAIAIRAPLLHLSKKEIILEARRLNVDLSLTSSCYHPSPDGTPCGRCDSCRLRRRGFEEAGLPDPAVRP